MVPLTAPTTAWSKIDSHDVYFFDDIELLPVIWKSSNQDNVGQLLIGFFNHFARAFAYNTEVVSIRSTNGLLSKVYKGWHMDVRFLLYQRFMGNAESVNFGNREIQSLKCSEDQEISTDFA